MDIEIFLQLKVSLNELYCKITIIIKFKLIETVSNVVCGSYLKNLVIEI